MTDDILTVGQTSGNNTNNNQQSEDKKRRGSLSESRRDVDRYRKLGFLTAKEMVYKFLNCDRMEMVEIRRLKYTKEELAKKLSLTLEEIKEIESPSFYRSIAGKITLPLAGLYCSTKWAIGKKEKKEERYETTSRV